MPFYFGGFLSDHGSMHFSTQNPEFLKFVISIRHRSWWDLLTNTLWSFENQQSESMRSTMKEINEHVDGSIKLGHLVKWAFVRSALDCFALRWIVTWTTECCLALVFRAQYLQLINSKIIDKVDLPYKLLCQPSPKIGWPLPHWKLTNHISFLGQLPFTQSLALIDWNGSSKQFLACSLQESKQFTAFKTAELIQHT